MAGILPEQANDNKAGAILRVRRTDIEEISRIPSARLACAPESMDMVPPPTALNDRLFQIGADWI